MRDDQAYSQAHFNAACEKYGDPTQLDKYETIFIDSITVAGRLCCLLYTSPSPRDRG